MTKQGIDKTGILVVDEADNTIWQDWSIKLLNSNRHSFFGMWKVDTFDQIEASLHGA